MLRSIQTVALIALLAGPAVGQPGPQKQKVPLDQEEWQQFCKQVLAACSHRCPRIVAPPNATPQQKQVLSSIRQRCAANCDREYHDCGGKG
jgi:hypothetical protein